MKYYSLNNYSENQINQLKEFIKKAILGYTKETMDEKVDEMIDQLKEKEFAGSDTLIFEYSIKTIGNDVLTALGVIKNLEKNKEK